MYKISVHKSDIHEYINQINIIENESSLSANKLDIEIKNILAKYSKQSVNMYMNS